MQSEGQSKEGRKGNFKQNDVVLKELIQSEGCTCYVRGTVGHDIMIWYANEKINLRIQVEQKNYKRVRTLQNSLDGLCKSTRERNVM